MKIGVVIVGGGQGARLKSAIPKAFIQLGSKPLYQYSLEVFQAHSKMEEIVLVVPPDFVSECAVTKKIKVVAGGQSRQDSVWNGLEALSRNIDAVLVHDAARPFLTTPIIDRLVARLKEGHNAIAAIPVSDTLKAAEGNQIIKTVDRQGLWRAQTPQAFKRTDLRAAFVRAKKEGWMGTDEASLVERLGKTVHLVWGDPRNIKITTAEDLQQANSLLISLS